MKQIMLIVLLIGAVLSTAESVLVGTPCTNHTFCNFEGAAPMHHTKCDSDSGNTCQCTKGYYGETNDASCVQAQFGDDCSSKADGSAYCKTVCGNADCVSSEGSLVCACSTSHYLTPNNYGLDYCEKITIGTSCNSTGDGDAFCQAGITNSECNVKDECDCPAGEVYVAADQLCRTKSHHDNCTTCKDTVGQCYDLEADNSPSGCTCPPQKTSSGVDLAATLVVGCDMGLAQLGQRCKKGGSPQCAQDHSHCTHARSLNNHFTCVCEPGYYPIPSKADDKNAVCYRTISEFTDANCQWCIRGGGVCYDSDEDGLRDGCYCPISRSTSDPHDPTKDCDIIHVEVTCATTTMKVCYMPHNTPQFPNLATNLAAKASYVYMEDHLGIDPCVFQHTNESGRDDWCLSIGLNFGSATENTCGTILAYPKTNVISFQNRMIVQVSVDERSNDDIAFYLHCNYDTMINTFTLTGVDVEGFVNVASEGEKVHPVLEMTVYDEFRRDGSEQGVRLGQPATLEITMTDTKDVYSAIRAKVCIASSRPQLSHPDAESILLLFDGCPTPDSYLNLRNTFRQDLRDKTTVFTGLFPMFKFSDSDYVYFHCAVEVCRTESECAPVDCSSRRKRSIGDEPEKTAFLSRAARDETLADTLESLQSDPVRVLTSGMETPLTRGETQGKSGGWPAANLILILGITVGVACLICSIGLVIAYKVRRARSSNAKVLRNHDITNPTVTYR